MSAIILAVLGSIVITRMAVEEDRKHVRRIKAERKEYRGRY